VCFDFSLQLLSETFLILRIQRDNIINAYKFLCKVPLIFEKSSNVNIHECPSSGGRVVPWMDGQTDMTKLIIALHNFANVPKVRKVNSRNFSLALRLFLLSMLLATWGHCRKRAESYFVCQILIKGNSCDSETRVGVSTGENQQSKPSILGSCRCCVDWPSISRTHTPKNLPSLTSCGHEKKHKTRIIKDCAETDHSVPQKVWQATTSARCCSSHLMALH
jgi:hypothetical protein